MDDATNAAVSGRSGAAQLYDAPVAGDPHLHVTIWGMSREVIPTR